MRLVWLTKFVSSPPQNGAKNLCLVGGVRWMDERIFVGTFSRTETRRFHIGLVQLCLLLRTASWLQCFKEQVQQERVLQCVPRVPGGSSCLLPPNLGQFLLQANPRLLWTLAF